MAEPIGPEAYLAIAASVQNVINNCRDKRRAKQNDKLSNISTDSSKSSLTLPANELLSYSGLKVGNDGYMQWPMDSQTHPMSWSRRRKAYDFGLILFSEFFMSAISAAGTPAYDGLEVLGHGSEMGLVAFTTMYLLGQALGALLLSPYCDQFGRRTLYIGSAFLYSIFCLPVATTSNIAGVFVGRFITGIISAIPAATTRLSVDDLFDTEDRMWAFFVWALVTNLGLILGPVYASYIAASLDWRWPFYLATIIVAVTGILMCFIRESYITQLLERNVAAIQSHRADLILRTARKAPHPSFFHGLLLLSTNPIIFLSSLAWAFSTALLYLFAVAFPLIYAHYEWNSHKTTLILLFIALGLLFSTITRLHERHITRKFHLTNQRLPPAKALFGLACGAPALAVGLWWFAWTIPGPQIKLLTWPASALSLIPIGYGINEYSTTLLRYVLDSYPHDATSAFTAMLTLRALLSAAFPLFTRQMFSNLGNNSAASVLAAVATAFCLLPLVLIKLGAKWNGHARSISSDSVHDSGHSAPEAKKTPKPKKTVRWDDETSSEVKGEDSIASGSERTDTSLASAFDSSTPTRDSVCAADFPLPESTNEHEHEHRHQTGSELSRVSTRHSDTDSESQYSQNVEIGGLETIGAESEKKKEREKEMARVDDGDDGAVGFMGLDVARMVGFPYV